MRKEFLRIRNGIKKGDDGEKLRDLEMVAYEGEITLVLAGRILEMECLSNLLSGRDSLSYGTVYYRGEKVSDGVIKKGSCLPWGKQWIG